MNYRCVIAIDPGGTSGVALRLPNGEIHTCYTENMVKVARMPVTFDPSQLYDMLSQPGLEHIVCENFAAETVTKYGLHTVRLVGGVEAIAYMRGIPFTRHQPSDRRPFLQPAKEILLGKKAVIHEIDALAHLLKFEYDNNIRNI